MDLDQKELNRDVVSGMGIAALAVVLFFVVAIVGIVWLVPSVIEAVIK